MEIKSSDFDTKPVGSLLFRLALPSIAAQIVSLIYNIVDRIFLGHIEGEGTLVLASLALVLPVINVVNAFANWVGTGGGPLAAIYMGKKSDKEAEHVLTTSVFMLGVLSVLMILTFLIFGDAVLSMVGADETTLPYASEYLKIYMLGSFFVLFSIGLNPFLTTQGFNKISMRNIFIGAVLNIVLDPVLIYGFDLGIKGAAIATVFSQAVSAVLSYLFLVGKTTKIKLKFGLPKLPYVKGIIKIGVSVFFMGASESVVQAAIYNQLLLFGDRNYVAATAIMYSIVQFIFLIIQGVGQGAQPIISYNYGAKNEVRVKQTLRLLIISCTLISFFEVVFIELFPSLLIGFFTNDDLIMEIGIHGLRIFVLGRFFTGTQLALQEFFRSVGDAKTTILNATARKFIFLVPFVYLIPLEFGNGTDGVFMAECVADILAVVVAVISYFVRRKSIFSEKAYI